ncbi:MAG: hypothetical protein E7176_03465 [Erysipelotrichaceae bacterium]|nr:hypothetical protein [Erysipelotrichaceae bacterium]
MRIKYFKSMLSLLFLFVLGLSVASCDDSIPSNDSIDNDKNDEALNEEESSMSNVIEKYIDKLIQDTPSYIPAWNKENFKGRWNYIDGVFLNSIVSLYYTYKDTNPEKAAKYKDFFISYINYYISPEGKFLNLLPNSTNPGYTTTELDSVCASKILFDAYDMTKDIRYKKAIEHTYNNLINMPIVENSYGNFSHKVTYLNQIWLDGMYMYVPFYARYAIATSNAEIFDKIKLQYQFIREKMYDENKKLYYHGYSSKNIFWADENGLSENFWIRSMGWYIVSLADVIELFPTGDNKEYLKNLLKEAIEGVLGYQDSETKMFYQLIDKGNNTFTVEGKYLEKFKNEKYKKDGLYVDASISNYVESSGSSMIAYAIMKASNLGYIDSSYLQKGKEIFEGICNHSFDNNTNTLNDICITAGLGPESNLLRDGSVDYYLAEPVGSNDAKGVGPFIMAYLQYSNGNVSGNNNIKF